MLGVVCCNSNHKRCLLPFTTCGARPYEILGSMPKSTVMLTYKGLCSTESSLYEQEFSPSVFHLLDTWCRRFILRAKRRKSFNDRHRRGVLRSFPLLVNLEAEPLPFYIYWEHKAVLFQSSQWIIDMGREVLRFHLWNHMLGSYPHNCNFGNV